MTNTQFLMSDEYPMTEWPRAGEQGGSTLGISSNFVTDWESGIGH
jgi:hypothetical protein